ncbi:MAG TPA: IS1 family transposase [Trichocoleus sp.]
MVVQVEAAECDEMWSFVGSKAKQRWLWHAIDHHSGQVLAYVLAPHVDRALVKLKQLLLPLVSDAFTPMRGVPINDYWSQRLM